MNNTRKPTVTIGIPAYNESANIGRLINDVLGQKQNHFRLAKIIVVSDCSSDATVSIVKKIAATAPIIECDLGPFWQKELGGSARNPLFLNRPPLLDRSIL